MGPRKRATSVSWKRGRLFSDADEAYRAAVGRARSKRATAAKKIRSVKLLPRSDHFDVIGPADTRRPFTIFELIALIFLAGVVTPVLLGIFWVLKKIGLFWICAGMVFLPAVCRK